MALVYSIIT